MTGTIITQATFNTMYRLAMRIGQNPRDYDLLELNDALIILGDPMLIDESLAQSDAIRVEITARREINAINGGAAA